MKTALALLLLMSVAAFGQGTSIRANNGQGTNTTIFNGLSLNPGTAASGKGVTNTGPLRIYVGADAFGSGFEVYDTNGAPRIDLEGAFLNLTDTNGNVALRIGTDGALLSSGQFTGNGLGLTNLAVSTNTWGNAVIPFDRGPNLRTNMAGNLTITGVTGFQDNVYNQVFVRLVAGGSDRTLTVPAAWTVNTNTIPVNTFTNATTATIAANTLAWLFVEMLTGIETNAYLLGSYP